MSSAQKDPVIAIDGPSGVGKSSTAKRIAVDLQLLYLDTGAMYRAITYAWHQSSKAENLLNNPTWLQGQKIDFDANATLHLNGQPLKHDLRTAQVTADVSMVSAQAEVRDYCTNLQRQIGRQRPSILDGRDIGTVVFPNAFLKIFLTASQSVRAERRWLELGGENASISLAQVEQDLITRDRKDASRAIAPLKKAEDAIEVCTDHQTIEAVVDRIKVLASVHAARYAMEAFL